MADQAQRLLEAQEIFDKYGIQNPLANAPTAGGPIMQPPQPQAPTQVPEFKSPLELMAPYLPMTAEMGGVLYGATKGAEMMKPFGKQAQMAGMFFGGSTGAVLGESARQLIQEGELDPLKAINAGLESGLWFGMGESVGMGMKVVADGISNIRAGTRPTDQQLAMIQQLQNELKEFGLETFGKNLTLTPAQIFGQGVEQTLEAIGKAGFGGETRFNELYEKQADFVVSRMKSLVGQLTGKSRQEVGKAFQETMEEADAALTKWAEPQYATLDAKAAGAKVNIGATEKELKKRIAGGKVGRTEGSTLDPKTLEVYNYVLGAKKDNTYLGIFNTIRRISSDLRTAQGMTDRNKVYEKALRDARELLEQDLERSAKATFAGNKKAIYDEWTTLNQQYKNYSETLNTKTLAKLSTEAPEFVGEQIAKQGNVTAVEEAFKAIDTAVELGAKTADDARLIKQDLQGNYLRSLLETVETKEQAVGALAQLMRQIKNSKQGDTFTAVLDDAQRAKVVRFLGYADHLESTSSGAFSLVVRGRQAGSLNQAITSIGGGSATAGIFVDPTIFVGSLAILTAPTFLAKRALNPKTADAFLDTLRPIVDRVKKPGYQLTKSDFLAVTTMLAENFEFVGDELPPEMFIKGLKPRQAAEYQANRGQIIAETGQDIGILPN